MAAAGTNEDYMDVSKLKVPDLKRELKTRGLSTSGNKSDLMERLQSSLKAKMDDTGSAESVEVDDLDDDLLNDDDLDHDNIDASESVLKELDEQLNVSPTCETGKRKLLETQVSTESDMKPAKKVVLNREPLIASDSNHENENGESDVTPIETSDDTNSKKVIKLSELSAKDRLEMRVKRFGQPTSSEAKKVARAQRFATGISTASSLSQSEDDTPGLNTLKKRAERFGGSVSKAMSNIELQERLEKRKKRFGVVTASNGAATESNKAKQRLERFKTSVK